MSIQKSCWPGSAKIRFAEARVNERMILRIGKLRKTQYTPLALNAASIMMRFSCRFGNDIENPRFTSK